jgi:protein-disulfide isomerase
MRITLALIPLLVLAACGGGSDGNSASPATSATSATPVAAASAPAGKAWVDVVAKTPDGGYIQGNPHAPIKLVEYGSRNCPYCAQFGTTGIEPLRQKYIATGKVSYEFRDYLIHGAPDFAAALLNQCVATEAFFPMLDQFFANQPQFEERTMALQQNNPAMIQQLQSMAPPQAAAGFAEQLGMIDFMKQRGVPEAKARQCLTDQKKIDEIAKAYADASAKGISSTPTFFINDARANAGSWEQLEPLLRQAGAR